MAVTFALILEASVIRMSPDEATALKLPVSTSRTALILPELQEILPFPVRPRSETFPEVADML